MYKKFTALVRKLEIIKIIKIVIQGLLTDRCGLMRSEIVSKAFRVHNVLLNNKYSLHYYYQNQKINMHYQDPKKTSLYYFFNQHR